MPTKCILFILCKNAHMFSLIFNLFLILSAVFLHYVNLTQAILFHIIFLYLCNTPTKHYSREMYFRNMNMYSDYMKIPITDGVRRSAIASS